MKFTSSSITNQRHFFNNKPIFTMVEFNLLNHCNRSCSFCPVAVPYEKLELPIETYGLAMMKLKELNYTGLIVFSGFSEPTLHSDLYELIDIKTQLLPDSTLLMNTNGDRLSKDMIDVLFRKGLDVLQVSCYDEKTLNKFSDDERLVIRDRVSNKDFINNRAGSLYNIDKPLNTICNYPYYTLYIDYNGDLLLCCHDYKKQYTIGNVLTDNIHEVWLKENTIRGNRDHNPCKRCDVMGNKTGNVNYETYKLYKENEERT